MKQRRQHSGVYSDEHPDPAPDVFTVARKPGGVFSVRHFPAPDVGRSCCVVEVTQRVGEDDVDTLLRASALCDRKHDERAAAAEAIACA